MDTTKNETCSVTDFKQALKQSRMEWIRYNRLLINSQTDENAVTIKNRLIDLELESKFYRENLARTCKK
jgi:hypothetical protein